MDDYQQVQQIIAWLHENYMDQPDMTKLSKEIGISQDRLTLLFQNWAGITPMTFLKAISLNHAKHLLRQSASILDTSYEIGFSSPSRLYDLFVVHEAMTPGQFKEKGRGLIMHYGYHTSPFGLSILVITEHGLAGIGFCEDDHENRKNALEDMQKRWPNAQFFHTPQKTAPFAKRVFQKEEWQEDQPLKIVLIGTDFEIRIWEQLLSIPFGYATTYGDIAKAIDNPKAARAVGAAVGKNPISFVVPCHRVLGKNGALTGYHWGLPRKKAMLGWECGLVE